MHQFVGIRRALREEKAPGYPYEFRDVLGLRVGDPRLVVRAYQDPRGITLVYYGKDAVATSVQVNKAALGFPGKRTEDIRVSLKKDEAGYEVLLV